MDDRVLRAASGTDLPMYLTFGIGDDAYAVPIPRVREVLRYPRVTKVPETPPWIRGVMNLRGSVVPVVDLGAKFGLGPSQVTRTTCVVVLEVDLAGQAVVMGIMTDRVNKVVALGSSEVEPPPAFGTRVRPEYLLAIARIGDGLACILDVDRVLSAEEILAAEASAREAGEAMTPPRDGPESEPPPAAQAEAPAPTSEPQSSRPPACGGRRKRAGARGGRR